MKHSAPRTPPRVVALMPTWRAAAFVRVTLESLAAQDYENLAVLISDDASPDGTAEICADFAVRDSRFRLIRQPRNLGWIGNVNFLLSQAHGDYLFFAFHDDPLQPEYVTRLVDALENNPDAVLAFTDVALGPSVVSYDDLDGVRDRVERARRFIYKRGLWWIPNRGLFRAEAATRIGGLRRHLAGEYSADWPWLLHLTLLGEFVRVSQPLVRKVWRTEGLSVSWGQSLLKSCAVLLACSREINRAGLPWGENLVLQRELVRYAVGAFAQRFTAPARGSGTGSSAR
jgi:glycosyltransferase involved in cell wall biosynthesis